MLIIVFFALLFTPVLLPCYVFGFCLLLFLANVAILFHLILPPPPPPTPTTPTFTKTQTPPYTLT